MKNKNENRKPVPDKVKKGFRRYCTAVMAAAVLCCCTVPAFAADDPLHVIPATAVGAAVAGALSMVFGCTLIAPHGGIFVFPVVGNWPMYLVALAAGSVITMFMLALLKKPVYKEN